MTIRTSHLVAVAVLLVGSAVCHGYWTNRWTGLATSHLDGDIVATIDPKIGDWEGGESTSQSEEGQRPYSMARRFTNHHLNKSVTISLISGIPGKVATHTPDVCYPGSGYRMKTEIKLIQIPIGEGKVIDCYMSEFQKTTASGTETLRVRWTWTDGDGEWNAPSYPRWFYARSPILHKLYVVYPVSEDDTTDDRIYQAFVGDLIERLTVRIRKN